MLEAVLGGIKTVLGKCAPLFDSCLTSCFLEAMLTKVALFFIIFNVTASAYYTLRGDTRVVKGLKDAPFDYQTTLPGTYVYLVSGTHNVTLQNGNCSTPFFSCSYSQADPTLTTVTMRGYMSFGLKWATFMGGPNQIPISIVFFTDNVWNDLAAGSIQPQYSVPLIVPAKGMQTVTLTCSIFSTSAKFLLYVGSENTLYYSNKVLKPVDETKKHPQILNLEIRNILLHKVITLTVKRKNDIDFYGCNTNDDWLTHTIDWTQSGANYVGGSILPLFVIILALVGM